MHLGLNQPRWAALENSRLAQVVVYFHARTGKSENNTKMTMFASIQAAAAILVGQGTGEFRLGGDQA